MSGRKAVFLSSPISPRRHLFVTVQFLHRRHVKGSPSLSKAAKMAFRSSLAVGSRCRRKRERVFLTFHCDFENMQAGHLSRQYVQRFISPGTNGCAFTFRDAFCGGGRVLYCGSALRFSPVQEKARDDVSVRSRPINNVAGVACIGSLINLVHVAAKCIWVGKGLAHQEIARTIAWIYQTACETCRSASLPT